MCKHFHENGNMILSLLDMHVQLRVKKYIRESLHAPIDTMVLIGSSFETLLASNPKA